jgi:uncharacterized iron-regulated membrane protein
MHDGRLLRVYVHPETLKPLKAERDDHRVMELVAHLHGSLLLGDRGSMLVELAGSWRVVMFLTGFCLWLPRGRRALSGVVYPRLDAKGRVFWRDLHAVSGFWVSSVTLFMLLSGLPWAVSWGNYLTWARNPWSATTGAPDWPIGGSPASVAAVRQSMPGMTEAEMAAMLPSDSVGIAGAGTPAANLLALDYIVPMVARLDVPRPI